MDVLMTGKQQGQVLHDAVYPRQYVTTCTDRHPQSKTMTYLTLRCNFGTLRVHAARKRLYPLSSSTQFLSLSEAGVYEGRHGSSKLQ